jgi:hypothetical protein
MAESSKEGKARAEARFEAVAKKQTAADARDEERRLADRAQEDKTARLKGQRLARDEADRAAAEAARQATTEALQRKRPKSWTSAKSASARA